MDGAAALKKYGKSLPQRACDKCRQMFTPRNVNSHRWCKTCCPNKSALCRLKKFNLSQPEYDQMLSDQGGLCALCRDKPALVVDHLHHGCERNKCKFTCGKCVRGLLCKLCNLFLAAWEAHPDLVQKGRDYISRYQLKE